MFNSGYPAEKIVNEIEKETNISFPVSKEHYVSWINAFEQSLYSDIIKEERTESIESSGGEAVISLFDLPFDKGDDDMPRTSDIRSIYIKSGTRTYECEKTEKSDILSGISAKYSYCISGEYTVDIYSPKVSTMTVIIARYTRPVPKKLIGDLIIGTIALPFEYLDLLRCKLRCEKYRLMNEDLMCAKWAEEYNYLLEQFKQFIFSRRSEL